MRRNWISSFSLLAKCQTRLSLLIFLKRLPTMRRGENYPMQYILTLASHYRQLYPPCSKPNQAAPRCFSFPVSLGISYIQISGIIWDEMSSDFIPRQIHESVIRKYEETIRSLIENYEQKLKDKNDLIEELQSKLICTKTNEDEEADSSSIKTENEIEEILNEENNDVDDDEIDADKEITMAFSIEPNITDDQKIYCCSKCHKIVSTKRILLVNC